jgi:hypothetical protein
MARLFEIANAQPGVMSRTTINWQSGKKKRQKLQLPP